MSPDRTDVYQFRTGYLKFKSVLCDRNTGLVSYRMFFDEIRRFFETRETVAVIVAVVQGIRRVESIYGWQASDELLVRAARAMREVVRMHGKAGAILAQDGIYQGRFVLCVPQDEDGPRLTRAALDVLIDAVRDGVDAAFSGPEFGTMTPAPRAGVGGTILEENPFLRFERQVSDAVHDAGELAAAVPDDTAVRDSLRAVLDREHVEVLFRPVIALGAGKIVGYEAVARAPDGTPLSPRLAWSAAEATTEMAGPVEWICRKSACEAAVDLDPGSLLFLDVRPASLAAPGDDRFSRLLAGIRRQPEAVVLQVSEQECHQAGIDVRQHLAQLKALGFRLALARAGSGYATLKLMEEIQPAYVKVDATLVHGIDVNLLKQEVVRSVIKIARRLECEVVTPGLESAAEATAVRRLGVQLGQGDHLAPPAPPDALRLPEPGSFGGAPGP
ncbi:MAG: EAL domain-containing protein [Acidobacteriota bacterium]